MTMRGWPLLVVTFALAACGHSPPTHYFTLDPVAGPAKTMTGLPVRIGIVHLPADLDRLSMVRESAPDQLNVDDQNRWSGPLDALVRMALARNLAERLPAGMVILPNTPGVRDALTVVVDIASFRPDAGGTVKLEGTWSLLSPASNGTASRHAIDLSAQGAQDAAGQANVMSGLIGKLADEIAAALAAASPK
jgi:uncharacterized lipoprotein YmbA